MDENINLAGKIEKLIVDGQQEVMQGIAQLRDGQNGLKEGQKRLEAKIDTVHSSLKKEIAATAYAIKDDIKDKIDEHLRLAHAGT